MIKLEAIYLQVAFSQPELFSIQVKHKGDSIYKVIARDTHGTKLYKYEFRSNMEIATGFIAAGTVSEFLSRGAKDFRAYCGRITVSPAIADRVKVTFEGHANSLCKQNASGYWDNDHYDYLREENNAPIPCGSMIPAEAFNNNSPTLQVANIIGDSGTSMKTDTDIESGADEDVFYRVNKPHEEFTPTDIYNLVKSLEKKVMDRLNKIENCPYAIEPPWELRYQPTKDEVKFAMEQTHVPTQRFPCDNPFHPNLTNDGHYLRPLCYIDYEGASILGYTIPQAICFDDAYQELIDELRKEFAKSFTPNPTTSSLTSALVFTTNWLKDQDTIINDPEIARILYICPYDADELDHPGVPWYLLHRNQDALYMSHRSIEFTHALVVDHISSDKSKQLINDGQMIDPFLFPEKPSGFSEGPENSGESSE